jgi:hypothetical protein
MLSENPIFKKTEHSACSRWCRTFVGCGGLAMAILAHESAVKKA